MHCLCLFFGLHLLAISLLGCASPGAPIIRTDSSDGLGPFISDCYNVSPRTPTLTYQTNFYLSTWLSAPKEGVESGIKAGLSTEKDDDLKTHFTKGILATIIGQISGDDSPQFPETGYCRVFEAPPHQVANAVRDILPELQNPVVSNQRQEAAGIFRTDYMEREHSAAKWRDRYLIHLQAWPGGRTKVVVYRDLWIARHDSWISNQDHSYAQAESNGGNEAWILQRIAASLGRLAAP